MKTIGDRLRYFRETLGVNQSQMAREIGLAPSFISGIERGAKEPSREIIKRLLEHYKLNTNWLLTGEGEMFLSDRKEMKYNQGVYFQNSEQKTKFDTVSNFLPTVTTPESETERGTSKAAMPVVSSPGGEIADPRQIVVYRFLRGKPVPVEVRDPDPEGAVLLPLFSQPTAAGPGQPPNQLQETERSIPVLYTLLGSRRPENCALVRVAGDSMADIGLFNGDYVLFDRSDRSGDGIFVISVFGETRVKRLQYRLADQKILIASENAKRYPEPEVVPMNYIQEGNLIIHGRVFAWLHRHPY
jgi:SOS-response transcriptional repressor LexA